MDLFLPHISKSYKDSILSIEGQSYDNIISTITKLKYVKMKVIVTSGEFSESEWFKIHIAAT